MIPSSLRNETLTKRNTHTIKQKTASISLEIYSKSFSRPVVVLKHLIRPVKDCDVRIC